MEQIEKLRTDNPTEFWRHIKRLGPKNKSKIPLEIEDEDGNITTEVSSVLDKWKNDLKKMFEIDNNSFNDLFLHNETNDLQHHESIMLEPLYRENVELNHAIDYAEVERQCQHSKNGKAVGCDKIPNEVLKNKVVITMLVHLFNLIFVKGFIPSD